MSPHPEHFQIRNEVRSLTSFRFLAAFYVYLFHLQIRTEYFGDGILGGSISEGAVGMTMFFTLSGFILSHAYEGTKIDARAFYTNRFARIYPVYFLAAILALPWLFEDIGTEAGATSIVYALVSFAILVVFGFLLIQAWLPQTFVFWNNNASWSISVETFFYALFPGLRDLIASVGNKPLIFMFVALCIISPMIPASAIVFSNAPEDFALFYAQPIFRLPEFVAGIVSYQLARRVAWTPGLRNFLLVVLLLGVLHVALLGPFLPGFTLNNWILIPAVSAALVLLHKAEAAGSKFLGGAVMVWLGQISYCFYSFQFHVLEGLDWVMPPERADGWVYALGSFVLLLAVSALVHHFVEEPARVWIRNRAQKSRKAKGAVA